MPAQHPATRNARDDLGPAESDVAVNHIAVRADDELACATSHACSLSLVWRVLPSALQGHFDAVGRQVESQTNSRGHQLYNDAMLVSQIGDRPAAGNR